jgi:hypothetical protein
MRFLAALCSLLLLLAPAARPAAAADEVVLDDSGAGVQSTGIWATSTTSAGFFGSGYHYRVAGDGSSAFTWPAPANLPAGSYEVAARWSSGDNRASNAPYLIISAAGTTTVNVDQRRNGDSWQTLGTFTFDQRPGQGVRLSDRADGVIVADAVRWLPAGSTPAPAPVPVTAPAPPPPAATPAPAVAAAPTPAATTAETIGDERFYDATSFRVDRDAFWDFFSRRGGVRTFGYPVSRELTFFGCQAQLFQRVALQQCGTNGVGTLNVLDDGLLPYTRFRGSVLPTTDARLMQSAPLPSEPGYDGKAIDFVAANAPDVFDGEPVNFNATFNSTVTATDAFPQGGDDSLLPLINLQMWGLPTSAPAYDPTNHDFIYLRFQRGVMHYDKGCKCTQGLLLVDYLKSVLTGELLPDDLAAQAAGSPLLRAVPANRPPRATTFGDAFKPQVPVAPRPSAAAPAPLAAAPTAPTAPTAPMVSVSSPDYGMSAFLWGHPTTTGRDLKLVTDLGFRWQKTLFQWRAIEAGCKGCFDWTEADRVVKTSAAAGVQVIARLDFQPPWARKDGAMNGPPDNFQDYADFISAFVKRYNASSSIGRVAAIEVWNEVNLDREWGGGTIDKQQAAEYVRLLGLAYAAAKAADPSVTVITAGLSPTGVTNGKSADDVQYLQWLYDAGLSGKYDVLGAHGNVQAPEVDVALGSLPSFPHASFYFRRIEQLRDLMVRNGDADKRVWLLEFGWTADAIHPNYSWFAVTEDKKGANIIKALQYAREHWQPWIGVMTLWTLPDPTWTTEREEYWWAITNADGTARPAYTELLQARRTGALAGIPPNL